MSVSVVVPYHGEELYIKDCLASLGEQTYRDFEVIIVASGQDVTTDNIDIADSLNVKMIAVQEENVAKARNAGLNEAVGEYIMFLDCDDYLAPDYFEVLFEQENGIHHDILYGKLDFTWYKRDFYTGKYDGEDESSDSDEDNSDNDTAYEYMTDDKKSIAYVDLIGRRRSYQGITCLAALYSRKLIKENNISFDEELVFFCDMPFVASVLAKAVMIDKCDKAVYIKRKHNDPIHHPSLYQKIGKDECSYFLKSYAAAIEGSERNSDLTYYFEKKLISYFSKVAAPAIAKNEDKVWKKKYVPVFKKFFSVISDRVYQEESGYRKKLISAMRNADYKKIAKTVKMRNRVNMLKYLLKKGKFLRRLKGLVYSKYYVKKPIKNNLVIFESFYGRSYSDNPKYIFEKLNELYPGRYECVWFINKKARLPYPAKQIKRYSFAYYKYLATAKYFVFNSRQPQKFIKRKNTVFFETWHGTPLKKLVFDMEDVVSASPTYKKDFYYQSRAWDYLIAPNSYSDEIFRRAFAYDGKMLDFGYPRNDILYATDKKSLVADIKKKTGVPEDKKVILYAPTWRDDEYYGKGKYKFSLKLDIAAMKKELGDKYVLILRTHYFIADNIDIAGAEDFVYNLSKYDDVAELYLISDILITDYSSVFFDYANLRRPMLFYTYDIDKYKDVLRGFYIDMEKDIPGPLLYNTDEVIDSIKNIDDINDKYSGVYEEFYERFCAWEDGNASVNCINEVFK